MTTPFSTERQAGTPGIPGDDLRSPVPDVDPSVRHDVEISDTQNHLRVERGVLEGLIRNVLGIEGVKRASISLVLVDNATIREINRQQLGHDWPTDVITFPLSNQGEEVLAGELVVSGEMARDTAAEAGHDPWPELALYLVHGLLHLRGYDDLADDAAEAMRRREDEVLSQLGLSNPFSLIQTPPPARD